ncbi:hypothetical protein [Actibacterium sp. XHP0104]|uniref:hypothetical protein n=1 Tax=Actibacterium sp. XHP0104 TaxID=2984335 RepID=UPI0021E76477|nr:hypothetical protein [Actibacterium sp. XHP0104]MCV2880744.1 hypothetical protein [Actibacterium sp. XHP0104]
MNDADHNVDDIVPLIQLDMMLAEMGQGFNAYLERRAAQDLLRRLQAMSDADLARMGLARTQIVSHVACQLGAGTLAA